jgi:hypothetical protein
VDGAAVFSGADFCFYFTDFPMTEVRCSSAALALAIGCEKAGTPEHLARINSGENLIRVLDTSGSLPLYWRWQLARHERAMASRSPWRGQ